MRTFTSLSRVAILVAALGGASLLSGTGHLHAQVAVVVGPTSPLTGISLDQLREMYLGKVTKLTTGERVVLLESPQVRKQFYQAALKMSPDRVKRHWIAIVFSGGAVIPPKEIASADEMLRYVSEHPGAIGFLEAAAAGPSVKVLPVNGLKPHDTDYPVR